MAVRLDLREAGVFDGTSPNALSLSGHQQELPAAAEAHPVERVAAGAAVHAAHAAGLQVETHNSVGKHDRKVASVLRQRAALGCGVSQEASVGGNAGRVQLQRCRPVEAAHVVHQGIIA